VIISAIAVVGINRYIADIDRDTVLVLTKEVKQCSKCHCDCHCESVMHTPSDELDTGGPCVCDDCKCKDA